MSALGESVTDPSTTELVNVLPETRWDRFEGLLERVSERLNPILVKEARQALKSRQFTGTFMLMLAAGWAWSILGLAGLGPAVQYSAEGPTMFYGYFLILAFPLLIIAPYSAFHSLSTERQDRTYELVSITALSAGQILSGKLGGVMLQMLIYLSAIVPCLAFTYLLRGLDILTIILIVLYTCCLSLGASITGLLLAALAPPRQRPLVTAVLFVMGLALLFFIVMSWSMAVVLSDSLVAGSPYFWETNVGCLTFFANYFALAFLVARSQLTSVYQNRSTAVRMGLLVAQLCSLTWMAGLQISSGGYYMSGFLMFTALFWYFAGMFLTGEPRVLSPRVRRDLPQTALGRVVLTWFVPGPGTGYAFVVANILAAAVMANLPFRSYASLFRLPLPPLGVSGVAPSFLDVSIVTSSYVIIYLGIGRLLLALLAQYTPLSLLTRFIVHMLLLLAGSTAPLVIQWSVPGLWNAGYTAWQLPNPIWTIWESCTRVVPLPELLVPVLIAVAIVVLLANLPLVARELQQVYLPTPRRVMEDDELAAQAAGPSVPKNPWEAATD